MSRSLSPSHPWRMVLCTFVIISTLSAAEASARVGRATEAPLVQVSAANPGPFFGELPTASADATLSERLRAVLIETWGGPGFDDSPDPLRAPLDPVGAAVRGLVLHILSALRLTGLCGIADGDGDEEHVRWGGLPSDSGHAGAAEDDG